MGDENHELLLREGLELYRDVEKEDAAWELSGVCLWLY